MTIRNSSSTMTRKTSLSTTPGRSFCKTVEYTEAPFSSGDPFQSCVPLLTYASLSRHFKRVMRYARPSDYAHGAVAAAAGPGLLLTMERFAPSYVGKGGFAQAMRLGGFLGLAGGFLYFYQRSCCENPSSLSRSCHLIACIWHLISCQGQLLCWDMN